MNRPVTKGEGRADAIGLANRSQAQASDPQASVFVSASAGSGKTKLLVDRLLRLMLPRDVPDRDGVMTRVPGSDPARILCLTFTKAAAAEMSIRLQNRLGQWVMLPDADLDRELARLSVPTGVETRRVARELFARVLDLPGGMRIGTIHAFCQSLLRRFPIEAAISPHFTLIEETDARLAQRAAVEDVVGQGGPAVSTLAAQIGVGEFTTLIGRLQAQSRRILPVARRWQADPATVEAALMRLLGISGRSAEDVLCRACATIPDEDALRDGLRLVVHKGAPTARALAETMLAWLGQDTAARAADWPTWRSSLLTQKGEPRQRGGLNIKLAAECSGLVGQLGAEAARVIGIDRQLRAITVFELTCALLSVAQPVLERYATRKSAQGMVDYDDLIDRTLQLLDDPGAAWVLYKLDGGIDHLLLDEVQDTSPDQWAIAGGLTAEFFAGEGTHDDEGCPRTIFAVGDYKQSIYSFQGADPEAFRAWRQRFRRRAGAAQALWREPALTVSFRSTAPVLKLVDSVFANPAAARGVVEPEGGIPAHVTARPGQGGRVEIWPPVPVEASGMDVSPWMAPRHNAGQSTAQQRLADTLAGWIATQLRKAPAPGEAALAPGDVLILVPRRSAFARALIRALKTHDVPVATLVRTVLTDQLAVRDLMALCAALLLPQDDLTLACVLTSPIGGLDDDSLMPLATGRNGQPLWAVLRARHAERPDWAAAWHILNTLFRQVDYATPYQLLAEALGPLGGRARLLARLGPEAVEPVDELLSAALRFEEAHAISLQGFLHWLNASDETVRHEPDASANMVRVMTAHGAKGLQARLVILPDTIATPRSDTNILWAADDVTGLHIPVWVPRRELATDVTAGLQEQIRLNAAEEYNRLLYVALTRASDRLVICGWEPGRGVPDGCWYDLCRQGFESAGATAQPFDLGWEGETLVLEEARASSLPAAPSPCADHAPDRSVPLPDWMGHAPLWRPVMPVAEGPLARPLAPSRPDDVALGPQPAVRSPLAAASTVRARADREASRARALQRGQLVHALLQYLPDCPVSRRAELADAWLARPAAGLAPAQRGELVAQVLAVMDQPALAALFAPGSRAEQPLAGVVGQQVIVGQVDRMAVDAGTVTVCDFKTNRHPPQSIDRTPVLYLRQMAAYRALLRGVYPGRQVVCALVWTEGVRVDILPATLLDRYAPDMKDAMQA
ncbi:double-strand break repair helicase AddA [Komagataeibacter rhaeticus]|uniref:double-strand break repair helicase AddA n=1 Tax=Komagataeibacter rhaeticus TaxID=215221 RepID=UPI0004D8FDDD|nr:double-strand break repair helicase AddA [Komagataeibacter rhaeticus]KDU97346.1 DNA helicase II [Komagataeibacter rhaeticus AF1]MBL7241196.1 double-strand break repair helicase AddA [Komagataeibacter rhaeticus]PYD53267.1 double-strand break repair helicase AddA [Komagataeibacter rhaeticus]GBQ12372.1 DNA helicase II [Komagataeibacter rhaeticus DSM 16663]